MASIARARRFVAEAPLPAAVAAAVSRSGTAEAALESGKQQAAVAGSEVVSFAAGVDAALRQDVLNCAAFAQLYAKSKVADPARIFDWYDAYFDALAQLGWAVQERGFAIYVETGQSFSAHEAILKVADALLAPATGSVALVRTTLDALRSMQESSPLLTLFDRESRQADAARFQISLAEQTADGALTVALMAFGLQARTTLTQVLFFKSSASEVQLRHCSGKVVVDSTLLAELRPALKERLSAHARSFIKALPAF